MLKTAARLRATREYLDICYCCENPVALNKNRERKGRARTSKQKGERKEDLYCRYLLGRVSVCGSYNGDGKIWIAFISSGWTRSDNMILTIRQIPYKIEQLTCLYLARPCESPSPTTSPRIIYNWWVTYLRSRPVRPMRINMICAPTNINWLRRTELVSSNTRK